MAVYEFLNQFEEISFHMPGHKGRIPVPVVDITELSSTDNLMSPEGIILHSQTQMAKRLGKQEAFFLTNGATGGILASVLAMTKENETVLVDRNCHISVLNGLILSGAVPEYVYPKENREFGIPMPLSAEDIPLGEYQTMILTSPTYYGEVCDVKAIRERAKVRVLIQDEAHGAHFYFSGQLKSFCSRDADLEILSFHKTMPTLNQGAVLARNTDCISSQQLKRAINLVQTTSPSYPILSSLDYAGIFGEELYHNDAVFEEITLLKQKVKETTPLVVLENQDLYKLLLNCNYCAFSAEQISDALEKEYRIYPEGVFGNNLLLMFSPCNTVEEIRLLGKALLTLASNEGDGGSPLSIPVIRLKQMLSPREAYFAEGEVIPVSEAAGRISKENITQFPPCIPLITIGEQLDKEVLSYIKKEFIEVVK